MEDTFSKLICLSFVLLSINELILELVDLPDQVHDDLLVIDEILRGILVVVQDEFDRLMFEVFGQHQVSLTLDLLEASRELFDLLKPS